MAGWEQGEVLYSLVHCWIFARPLLRRPKGPKDIVATQTRLHRFWNNHKNKGLSINLTHMQKVWKCFFFSPGQLFCASQSNVNTGMFLLTVASASLRWLVETWSFCHRVDGSASSPHNRNHPSLRTQSETWWVSETERQYPKIGKWKTWNSVFFCHRQTLSTSFDIFVVTHRVTNFFPKTGGHAIIFCGKNEFLGFFFNSLFFGVANRTTKSTEKKKTRSQKNKKLKKRRMSDNFSGNSEK